jgi:hypothetical protein
MHTNPIMSTYIAKVMMDESHRRASSHEARAFRAVRSRRRRGQNR